MRILVSNAEILERAWIRSDGLPREQCKKSGENKDDGGRGHLFVAESLCISVLK